MASVQKSAALVVPVVVVAATVFVGNGCAQLIGWEEPYLLPDAGTQDGGGEGGLGGAGGIGGAGGLGGGGGAGGKPECTGAADCPAGMNGQATCTGGVCGFTCTDGYGDCDGALGCEENLVDNRTHCGACGNQCVAQCKGMACNDPVSIAAGAQHFCAILKDGQLYCWGKNEKGELGDGTKISKTAPTKVTLPGGTTALQVDGGGTNTCALLSDKKVACWGTNIVTPTLVNGLSNIKQISVGDMHYCAVDLVGKLFCWGYNGSGQVGNGNTFTQMSPIQVATGISQVSAGGGHTCAVTMGGMVKCWGENFYGQLGNGNMVDVLTPTDVPDLAGVVTVHCGESHTCALDLIGMKCWGSNSMGELGQGNINSEPVPQPINLNNITAGVASSLYSGAIVAGEVWMWGSNLSGKIGNGSQSPAYSPTKISVTDANALALGGYTACALLTNGAAKCWGDNTFGQLGNGTTVSKSVPTPMIWP